MNNQDESDEIGKHIPVDKIFVGGIAHETTREALVSFFNTNFGGKVTRVRFPVFTHGIILHISHECIIHNYPHNEDLLLQTIYLILII